MSEAKTKPTDQNVIHFLEAIDDPRRRDEGLALNQLMREVTGEEPCIWGTNIIGYGAYRYRYASGREGDWPLVAFSPRKQNLTIYIMAGFDEYDDLMSRLGKHSTGRSCLYLKRLSDVDQAVLRELVARSVDHMRHTNPPSGV